MQEISKQVCCDIPLIAPPSNRTSSEVYCKISKKIECISEISVSQWLANLTQPSGGIYWQNLWLNKRKDSVRDFLQEIRIYEKHKKMQEALEALESRLDPQSPKLKFTSGFYNSLTNSGPSLSFIKQ